MKVIFGALLIGISIGASGMWSYEDMKMRHVIGLTERKFCGARDVDKNFYWQDCVDAGYAGAIARASLEMDKESASVFDSMAKNQPGKRKSK